MKIYNKKGLLAGALWTAAGAFCLYRDAVDAHDFLPQQIKSVVLSLVMLAVGLTCLVRAFSKSTTREDRIAELDERNQLVKLKYRARTFDIMFWITMAVMLLSLLAYLLTENLGWGFIFVTSGVLAGISVLVELIVFIYYERRS